MSAVKSKIKITGSENKILGYCRRQKGWRKGDLYFLGVGDRV